MCIDTVLYICPISICIIYKYVLWLYIYIYIYIYVLYTYTIDVLYRTGIPISYRLYVM